MRRGHDRPTGRQTGTSTGMGDPRTAGAHSAGYQEEYQQSPEYAQGQGRASSGQGYPSETVDYGRGGQGYPSGSAEYGPEGRRAGGQAYAERGGYGRGTGGPPARHLGLGAALMVLTGLLTFFVGITGIIKRLFFANVAQYPFSFNARGRGITELIIGCVLFLVGVCLLLGMHWARHLGTVVAVIAAIANFMFIPFYPFWSIILLALNVVCIWELAHHHHQQEWSSAGRA